MTQLEALQLTVARAGGQTQLALALNTYQPKVWRWLNKTKRLPAEYVLRAEQLYGVSRFDLRPDIYPRNYPSAPPVIGENGTAAGASAHRLSETAK